MGWLRHGNAWYRFPPMDSKDWDQLVRVIDGSVVHA